MENNLNDTEFGLPVDRYDMELDSDELERISVEELALLGPFGPGNPRPRFRLNGVNCLHCEPGGQKSVDLMMTLEYGGKTVEAIGPGMRNRAESLPENQPFDMIVESARVDMSKQTSRPQVLVVDLWTDSPGGEKDGR